MDSKYVRTFKFGIIQFWNIKTIDLNINSNIIIKYQLQDLKN